MMTILRPFIVAVLSVLAAVLPMTAGGCTKEGGGGAAPGGAPPVMKVLRVGHFPNITHAQALVAHGLSRQGKGWYEARLGPGVEIQWYVYNAGPSAMEAIFAGSIDMTYVGPNPALNAYIKSKGEEIRLLAGSAVGGSALVVQGDGRLAKPGDFKGRKVATPQLGNTQDVACRSWLMAQGFKMTMTGGEVSVIPTANPDQLALFQKGDLDAVWTVEPWVSRLVLEAKGRILLEEPDAVTTILVSSVRFLKTERDLARRFAQAHAELTEWMAKNPAEAQEVLRSEILAETTREIAPVVVESSWKRLRFTAAVELGGLEKALSEAQAVGFIKEKVDLSRLVEKP